MYICIDIYFKSNTFSYLSDCPFWSHWVCFDSNYPSSHCPTISTPYNIACNPWFPTSYVKITTPTHSWGHHFYCFGSPVSLYLSFQWSQWLADSIGCYSTSALKTVTIWWESSYPLLMYSPMTLCWNRSNILWISSPFSESPIHQSLSEQPIKIYFCYSHSNQPDCLIITANGIS